MRHQQTVEQYKVQALRALKPNMRGTYTEFKTPIGLVTVFVDRTGSKAHPTHTTIALGSFGIEERELVRLLELGKPVDPLRVHHPQAAPFDRLAAFRTGSI